MHGQTCMVTRCKYKGTRYKYQTYDWVMSHTYEWDTWHIWMTCRTCERVMQMSGHTLQKWGVWLSYVTHMNETHDTYEWHLRESCKCKVTPCKCEVTPCKCHVTSSPICSHSSNKRMQHRHTSRSCNQHPNNPYTQTCKVTRCKCKVTCCKCHVTS